MPQFKKSQCKVVERNGTTVIADNKDKQCATRNVSHFKRISDQTESESSSEDENEQNPEHNGRRSNRERTVQE